MCPVTLMRCPGTRRNAAAGFLLLAMLFSFLMVPLCSAEANFTTSPSALTIAAVRGDTETRTILILKNSPEATLDDIRIVPLDLERADNRKVIPASAISAGPESAMQPPNGITIPVRFGFNTSESGEYAGNLLINAGDSTTLVPVTVKLKDPILKPAVVLVLVTFLSVLFYRYATGGLKADKLQIKIQNVRSRISSECAEDSPSGRFTSHFQEKVLAPLNEATVRLRQGDYDSAETEYKAAETALAHWTSFGDQWKDRLRESVRTEKRLQEIITGVKNEVKDGFPPNGLPLMTSINRDLQVLWEDAAGSEAKPDTTRTSLDELNRRMDLFNEMYAEVKTIIRHLPDPGNITDCVVNLRKNILSLNYAESDSKTKEYLKQYPAEKQQCLQKLGEATGIRPETIKALQPVSPAVTAFNAGAPSRPAAGVRGIAQPVPPEEKPSVWEQVKQTLTLPPSISIFIYDLLHSVILPAGILIFLGFSQLYDANATFGVNGIGDYFTLVVWGFGAGTASDSLVALINAKTGTAAS